METYQNGEFMIRLGEIDADNNLERVNPDIYLFWVMVKQKEKALMIKEAIDL